MQLLYTVLFHTYMNSDQIPRLLCTSSHIPCVSVHPSVSLYSPKLCEEAAWIGVGWEGSIKYVVLSRAVFPQKQLRFQQWWGWDFDIWNTYFSYLLKLANPRMAGKKIPFSLKKNLQLHLRILWLIKNLLTQSWGSKWWNHLFLHNIIDLPENPDDFF